APRTPVRTHPPHHPTVSSSGLNFEQAIQAGFGTPEQRAAFARDGSKLSESAATTLAYQLDVAHNPSALTATPDPPPHLPTPGPPPNITTPGGEPVDVESAILKRKRQDSAPLPPPTPLVAVTHVPQEEDIDMDRQATAGPSHKSPAPPPTSDEEEEYTVENL